MDFYSREQERVLAVKRYTVCDQVPRYSDRAGGRAVFQPGRSHSAPVGTTPAGHHDYFGASSEVGGQLVFLFCKPPPLIFSSKFDSWLVSGGGLIPTR